MRELDLTVEEKIVWRRTFKEPTRAVPKPPSKKMSKLRQKIFLLGSGLRRPLADNPLANKIDEENYAMISGNETEISVFLRSTGENTSLSPKSPKLPRFRSQRSGIG